MGKARRLLSAHSSTVTYISDVELYELAGSKRDDGLA